MDTHDTRCINHDTPMQAGVVLTVEPGLYIPNDPQLYGPYAGIGVRIEDDVAVTGLTDPEVLSAGVPVDAREVELLVQGE
jgi:Xaa-Pro aminopeptidase